MDTARNLEFLLGLRWLAVRDQLVGLMFWLDADPDQHVILLNATRLNDTDDASAVDNGLFCLDHSYFSNKRQILDDLYWNARPLLYQLR